MKFHLNISIFCIISNLEAINMQFSRFGALSFLLILFMAISPSLTAQSDNRQLLWPDGAPGALGTAPEDKPDIGIYLAPTGSTPVAAVLICPGGGYSHLAMDHEGDQIARWYQERGVHAFVLKYRLAKNDYHHPAMINDAQRALRYIRSHAKEWKLDNNRVGIMGFSAGGHLASTAATHFDAGDSGSKDPIERESSRPDFCVLGYPVIAFGESFTHKGSQKNLIGENPSADMITYLSNEKQVTDKTPPTFLVHTDEDKGVPAENSVVFYLALRKAGVPAELHIYQKGRHGLGMVNTADQVFSTWANRLEDWLKIQGVIE